VGLIDEVKVGAARATSRARESLEEVRLRHELAAAYGELGRAAWELFEDGGHPDVRLRQAVEQVRLARARLGAGAGAGGCAIPPCG